MANNLNKIAKRAETLLLYLPGFLPAVLQIFILSTPEQFITDYLKQPTSPKKNYISRYLFYKLYTFI